MKQKRPLLTAGEEVFFSFIPHPTGSPSLAKRECPEHGDVSMFEILLL